MRDDVTNFSAYMKARLGGERFAWFVYDQGEIFSNCGLFVAFFLQCLTGVLPKAVQILQTWKSKSPGIAYHCKTKSCYPNSARKYGEQTRQ